MEKEMLEQIQQMITTATETLRREIVGSLDQKVDGLSTSLRAEMAGMKAEVRQEMAAMESRLGERIEGIGLAQRATESRLGERIEGIELAQRATESRLGERIEETKRHSGVLAEDLHHKLDLVIEGQQFLGQRIDNVQADLDAKTRETRLFLEVSHRQLNDRLDRHEQNHHT